ncbi:hypothetical protein RQP46_002588 [Phenoliferia psychrophenolica]
MRRIFGGANLPIANGTVGPDGLPSPGYSSSSQQPPLSPFLNSDQQQQQGESSEPARKGWFGQVTETLGTVGTGLANGGRGRSNTTTSSSAASTNGRANGGGGTASSSQLDEDEPEYIKLPFGSARLMSPPQSDGGYGGGVNGSANGQSNGHARDGSGGGRASALSGRMGESDRDRVSSPAEEKDALMVELLSGQAAIEAKEYQILDWDEMQDLKKEHTVLATKIAALSRSVALETKLRDSAAKLVRLSAPASSLSQSASTRPRATREQAEAQLLTANQKLSSLSTELYRVGWAESAVRTRLLHHTAGVLALSIRRREEEEQGRAPSPLPSTSTSTFSPSLPSHFNSLSSDRGTPSPSSAGQLREHRFDGASFFAGNREAFIPGTPRHNSNWTSPPHSAHAQTTFFPTPTPAPPAPAPVDTTLIKDLESQIADLRTQLSNAKAADSRAQDQAADSRAQAQTEAQLEITAARAAARKAEDSARKAEDAARDELAAVRREAGEARREAADLRREVDTARDAVREAKEATTQTRKELLEAQRDLEDGQRTAIMDRRGSTDLAQREVASARLEASELAKKMSMTRLELNEAEHRAERAEERLAEVEAQATRHENEVRRLRTTAEEQSSRETDTERRLRGEVSQLSNERAKVSQSLGDVLRRHRTRGVIGPVLRDLPSFDDTADREDLPSYLASTLDAHFDRVSSHVAGLNDSTTTTREEHEDAIASVQRELQQAVEHRERWRGEAEQHRRAKEQLESSRADLERGAQSQVERLASLASVESALAAAQAEESRLRSEIGALQAKLATAEAAASDAASSHTRALGDASAAHSKALDLASSSHSKALADVAAGHTKALAELSSQHAKLLKPLQDLWRSMPPLDTRMANSNSDDLSVLKAAFEQPKRPLGNFLADVTSSGKFTIESLSERVRILLAEDLKLVNRLMSFENDAVVQRAAAEKAQKLYSDSYASLQTHQRQVKELEERMDVSSNQEVTMLERLNDLTESLEQTRSEKRKAESSVQLAQAQVRALEDEKSKLKSQLASQTTELARLNAKPDDSIRLKKLENELADAADQLQDSQQELADCKKREQKGRQQLLEQLSTVEEEVSSLKTELRKEQRKKKA